MTSSSGRTGSSASLDVGYGKCPEFVCVDGLIGAIMLRIVIMIMIMIMMLIVSKDNAWTDGGSDSGQDQSLSMSHQGTLSTLR